MMRAVAALTGAGFAARPRARASRARPIPHFSVTCRNRILFRENEVERSDDGHVFVSIPSADPRALHARVVLKVCKGDTLRVGILNDAPATADVRACPTDADPHADLTLRWRPGEERDDPDTARRALQSRNDSANARTWTETRSDEIDEKAATHANANGGLRVTGGTSTVVKKLSENLPDRAIRIDLLLAVPRPKVLKRLWAPLASLGVDAVFLTNAARVEKSYFESGSVSGEIIENELIRGLEQSGDVHAPTVALITRFPAALDALGVTGETPKKESVRVLCPPEGNEARPPGKAEKREARDFSETHPAEAKKPIMLVAHPGSSVTLRQALRGAGSESWGYGPKRVVLAIGPEGGWSEYELTVLKKGGFIEVAVGNRTFATDVACVALVAAIKERTESW